ncbi:Ig-like domain repeat protein [Mumia zhuanghuii]|uniref:Ig-like domain repeat protein n=1 Tax=Mumia zhuanghuii TaxID=2585211 RepID=UPI00363FD9BE
MSVDPQNTRGWPEPTPRHRPGRVLAAAVASLGLTLSALAAIPANAVTPVPLAQAGSIVSWGRATESGATTVPAALSDTAITAIANGHSFSVALTGDNRVVAWGHNGTQGAQPQKVPASLNGVKVKAIAASADNAGVVTQAGTVVGWGYKAITGDPTKVPAGLSGVVDLTIGAKHAAAVKSDGTVVTWGNLASGGALAVPAGLTGVKKVAAGDSHTYALKSDGTVVAWGLNNVGQLDLPAELTIPGNVKSIASRRLGGLALLADGTVRQWGPQDAYPIPASLTGKTVVAISAQYVEAMALDSEGGIHRWDDSSDPAMEVPSSLSGAPVTAIAAGGAHDSVIVADVKTAVVPRVTGVARPGQTLTGTAGTFSGAPDNVTNQWLANGTPIAGATGTSLALNATHLGKRITYRTTATKGALTRTATSTPTSPVAKPTPTVGLAAPAGAYGRAGTVTVTVSNSATGTVTLTLNGRSLGAKTLSRGRTLYSIPRTTTPGRWTLRASYHGNTTLNTATRTTTYTVTKARPGTVKTKITKKPSSRKKGKATITIARPTGLTAPRGKVTLVLKKGSKKLKTTATVRNGKATVKLPKTTRGTWKITTTYTGDTRYTPAKAKTIKHRSK